MKRPLGFVDGIGVGIGGVMLLPLAYWMVVHGQYLEMYKQFGDAKLPSFTIFVMGAAWSYGAPLLLGFGLAFAIWQRPTKWLVFAIGFAALIASIATFYGAYLPMLSIAGRIR